MTKENDIVLVHIENMPAGFARVESILADSKKDWYHIKLLFLQVPLQVVTWILKDVYINGEEFSMNGKKIRLEPVKCPEETSVVQENSEETNFVHENSSAGKITRLQGKNNQTTAASYKKQNNKTKHTAKHITKQTEKQNKQNQQAKIISLSDIRKAKNKRP